MVISKDVILVPIPTRRGGKEELEPHPSLGTREGPGVGHRMAGRRARGTGGRVGHKKAPLTEQGFHSTTDLLQEPTHPATHALPQGGSPSHWRVFP